jgi:MOSC domain-containing protein YiiM
VKVSASVVGVFASSTHGFAKVAQPFIRLVQGLGVEGDAHAGSTVQHLYTKKKSPNLPNLRQIHLIEHELLDELAGCGLNISPGGLGENIATRNVDLMSLPSGTTLGIGREVLLSVTGLREPCTKIDRFRSGLRAKISTEHQKHRVMRRAIMTVVLEGGIVRSGDPIHVLLPPEPHGRLGVV